MVDHFTAADAAAHNLELVTRALDRAEVSYFLVRGCSPLRHLVGVHRTQRKPFLEVMRELYGSSTVHAAAPASGGGSVVRAPTSTALWREASSPARPSASPNTANGIVRLSFSPFRIGAGAPLRDEAAPNSAGKNMRHLLQERSGRSATHKFKHVPHPQIREVMLGLEERYAEDIARTVRSRFRSPEYVEGAANLHHHYALLTGRAVPGQHQLRYVDIGGDDAAGKLARLEEGEEVGFLCLNDLDTPQEAEERVDSMVHSLLEHRFPFPSPYEKPEA